MSSLKNKIQYTIAAVNDIQKALEERGFIMNGLPLEIYGNKIREIQSNENSQCENVIGRMSLMTPKDKDSISINSDMFIMNLAVNIENKAGNKQIQDKTVINYESFFAINLSSCIYLSSAEKSITEKSIITLGNMLVINNTENVIDMTLAIEEV